MFKLSVYFDSRATVLHNRGEGGGGDAVAIASCCGNLVMLRGQ
jgi:hypothetical protein